MTTDPAGRVALRNCPFCGSNDIDPEGWMGALPDPDAPDGWDDSCTGPECGACGATADTAAAWNTRAADAEIERLRQRERMCDSQCGAIQAMSEAWYRAEKEFDLPDDDPYQAIERLRAALQEIAQATNLERADDPNWIVEVAQAALVPASETNGE